jgi:hypothetical protein
MLAIYIHYFSIVTKENFNHLKQVKKMGFFFSENLDLFSQLDILIALDANKTWPHRLSFREKHVNYWIFLSKWQHHQVL